MNYRFYEIRSFEGLMVSSGGLRKRSLVCEGADDVFLFVWVNDQEVVRQIQFSFEEYIVEWRAQKGVHVRFHTSYYGDEENLNRNLFSEERNAIITRAAAIFKSSQLPGKFQEILLYCFTKARQVGSDDLGRPENVDPPQFHPTIQIMPLLVFKMVADADNEMDDKEWEVFEYYLQEEFPLDSSLAKLIFKEQRDLPALYERLRDHIEDLSLPEAFEKLKSGVRMVDRYLTFKVATSFKKELYVMGINVARASGGLMGMFAVSREEQVQLIRIRKLFGISR